MKVERNVLERGVTIIAMMSPSIAMAAVFSPAGNFCTFYNQFANPMVGVAAAVALLVFFIMMVTNEGNGFISWGIKMMVAISGALAIPSILGGFGVNMGC